MRRGMPEVCVFRISGVRLDGDRVPSGEGKTKLLSAIEHARTSLKLTVVLRLIGLSPSAGQVTATEIRSMHDMATSPEHRHMSVRTLALHAQRLGRVFVSAGTWLRLIRERGWRRPRTRVHPASPKQGVRATKPNEYWHIDVTIIKLLDGTKVYLHAVIDNLSRRILAWKVALRLEPQNTCAVLVEAGNTLPPDADPAIVVADPGVENVNGTVDALPCTSARGTRSPLNLPNVELTPSRRDWRPIGPWLVSSAKPTARCQKFQ